ncbi:MAG: GTP pyrophosphokinase family protein [Clostridia bacterium]|nr:GTP pyrophosphokinase family protein [Clostridia bacterium]
MKKHTKTQDLLQINNFLEEKEPIEKNSKTFEKLMFIYSVAMKELVTKIEIIKDEFKIFYNYELIDHINTRIKKPESIIKKMQDKKCELRYSEMINNINDIAGIRVICPLKKDIFSIRNLIANLPGVQLVKEKNYITKPKKSGYSSYHLILDVPVTLSQKIMYVRVEVQIRTMAMDFWASIEHKVKYKTNEELSKSASKELIKYAKIINKIDEGITTLKC